MARLLKTEPTHCDSALQLSKEELFLSEAHLSSSPHKLSRCSGAQQQPLGLHLDIQLKCFLNTDNGSWTHGDISGME